MPVKVLYELASPSTPETIIEMVEQGEIDPTIAAIRVGTTDGNRQSVNIPRIGADGRTYNRYKIDFVDVDKFQACIACYTLCGCIATGAKSRGATVTSATDAVKDLRLAAVPHPHQSNHTSL